ncbi:guanylate kinase [Roseburia sp. 499]|uniref:guanylate kinase n=1 Tax=Roseburia sp. 499 TaxID=1261634 RepID=UPI0009520447|nr:guanylate kinase [Roseburia sp. 499]WVK69722.1 guanylate kinase [Roseburia sp. 499]
MGKIFCLIGKSSCGKDTLYKRILSEGNLPLKTLVSYTTRPIRSGETNGVEYYFLSEDELAILEQEDKIIELRAYHTIHGIWKYFTVNDHQIDLAKNDYLVIGTLESFQKLQEYFGSDHLVPLYIEVDSGERLQRALTRERLQQEPKYAELCRRFLADESDFSPEKLAQAGITDIFHNDDLDECLSELISYIRKRLCFSDKKADI